ncbi:MAG: hypothetical protein ACK46X_08845 [Candidatus Sericytochromatia bacterium]
MPDTPPGTPLRAERLRACARFVAPDFFPCQEGRPELAAAFLAGMAGPSAAAA